MQGSSAAARVTPGEILGGKYRLVRPLGEGAMGIVWSARNEVTGRDVAIKLLARPEPELRRRFMREARACGALRHPNIVDLYDADDNPSGDPFLVLEHLTGRTLADLLGARRRLDPPLAARIARDAAAALGAAHEARIIHRDLKPSNLFLHEPPGATDIVVKVLDFGIAKDLSALDSHQTATGSAVGSPSYMSPEQARGDRDVDHRADLWALGVVLFEMVAGVRPFQGAGTAVIAQVLSAPIPRLSQAVWRVDPRLDEVVDRCLRRSREERWRSAEEVRGILDEVVRGSAAAGAGDGGGERRGSRPSWGGEEALGDTAPLAGAGAAADAQGKALARGGTLKMSQEEAAALKASPAAAVERPQAQSESITSTAPLVQPSAPRATPDPGRASLPTAPPEEGFWTRRTIAVLASVMVAGCLIGVVSAKGILARQRATASAASPTVPEALAPPPTTAVAAPAAPDSAASSTIPPLFDPAAPVPAATEAPTAAAPAAVPEPTESFPDSASPLPATTPASSPAAPPASLSSSPKRSDPPPKRSDPPSARPPATSTAAPSPSPSPSPPPLSPAATSSPERRAPPPPPKQPPRPF